MRLTTLLVALLALSAACTGTDTDNDRVRTDNDRLRTLVQADQAERQGNPTLDQWRDISRRDEQRREQVRAELDAGRVETALDYYNAALVMQHGSTLEDIRMAHALATLSASLDPTDRSALWLKAASWDRMMVTQGKPQWYGTQYVRGDDGRWKLHPVDESAVSDADRISLAVPTLAEAKQRMESMNNAR